MPKLHIGTMGFDLVWTAKIPPEAQAALQKKSKQEGVAAFDLTPAWGEIPSLIVQDLRRAEISLPDHWADSNVVFPIIHGIAFYIVPHIPREMAASFSMKGVNLRTGLPEELTLVDQPCQSYWTTKVHTPWIDGYRPNATSAVRQFVPLRGDKEMVADISNFVGISADHPWKDGISVAFYLPTDLTKLGSRMDDGWRGGGDWMAKGTLEASYLGGERGATRGATRSLTREVGMGAGALMRQQHPDVPGVSAKDFFETALVRMTARLVWVEEWNKWAREAGESLVSASRLRELETMQQQYETRIWTSLGGKPVSTNVDNFPTVG